MNVQNFNTDAWINRMLPPFLRQPKTFQYLHSLLRPLQTFRDGLVFTYQPLLEQKARYNSQVIVFEKVMNTELNTSGIYINTAGRVNRVYFFNHVELFPRYIFNNSEGKPLYLGNKVEYNPAFDFTVNAPQAVYNTSYDRLKGVIEKYKLVGVNYQILPY